MPSPLSRTARRTRPFSRAAVTTIWVPAGVWVSALSIRMRTIWATRTGSHWASMRREGSRSSRRESCWASVGSNSPDTERVSSARVDLLGAQLERARLQPREIEEIDGQLAQAPHLVADLVQEAAPRLRVEVLVLEQLQEPAQREHRRAQLVGGGGDELLAGQLELLELLLHLVERDGQLPELVGGVDPDRMAELARRHPLGRRLEPPDALGQGQRATR